MSIFPPNQKKKASPKTQRVALYQPALPQYRIPVFKDLASRPEINLVVYYENEKGIPLANPDGFIAHCVNHITLKTPLGPLFISPKQWRLARKKYCDVLILPGNTRYLTLIPSLLKARLTGVRTILWGHGYSKNESPLRCKIRDCVSKLANAILLYDQRTANNLISRGFKPHRVFVAPNAIDQTPIQEAKQYWLDRPDELAAFQSKHSLDSGPTILFVSRLDPANRLDLLIEALALAADDLPTAQAVIIGKGEGEQKRLKDIATQKGIADRVRFLGPIYEETELAPYFLSSQVFCYPANIGLSILHAFGYGLPVITSDKTEAQNPEIIALEPGKNGWTYQDNDALSLAKKLTAILSNPNQQANTSQAAMATANHFSIENMAEGMKNAACHTFT